MRDTSHADLSAFHARTQIERMRQDAFRRDYASRIRESRRAVEKGDHFRQLTAVALFTVCLLVWGFVIHRGLYGG